MSKLSISENSKYLLIIPFMYALISRYDWPRGFLVNTVTAWVPGVILVWWQNEISALHSVSAFVLGYVCFICIYEIGYMINDSFGLKHDSTPRKRVDVEFSRLFILLFFFLRLITFGAILITYDLLADLYVWTASLSLAFVLILHNTIQKVELKLITFLQLSLMRFTLPILFALLILGQAESSAMLFLIGLLLFTYPRFLTYLEAKDRLVLPERKAISFLMYSHLVSLPMLAVVATTEKSSAPIVVWAWYAAVQSIYILLCYHPFFSSLKSYLGFNKAQGSD